MPMSLSSETGALHLPTAVVEPAVPISKKKQPELTCWRPMAVDDPWSRQEYDRLKKEIQTHELIEKAGIEHINVLLLGECSAGKSSFFNSVESVYEGFVSTTAEAGTDEGSLTKQFRTYEIDTDDGDGEPIKFKYCDTMGVESTSGLSPSDFGKIMDGHITDLAELSQSDKMVPGSPGYNPTPTEADRMHCVAFVISAETLSTMDPTVEENFLAVLKEARA